MNSMSLAIEVIGVLGPMGIISLIVWYVLTKSLPKKDEAHETSRSLRDKLFLEALEKADKQRREDNERLVTVISENTKSLKNLVDRSEEQSRLLMLHDATMRNLANTGVTSTTTEDLATAAGVPREVIVSAVRAAAKRSSAKNSLENSQEFASEIVNHIILLAGAQS